MLIISHIITCFNIYIHSSMHLDSMNGVLDMFVDLFRDSLFLACE